ncbi:MAG TPA: hypothetical protein VMD47_07630 [Candidatus Acidoferrales bacterium]|nr:hypothetical protein [Candidatus Acidoferrales bacterium]
MNARLFALLTSSVVIISSIGPAWAQDANRYAPDGLVNRLKACTHLASGPDRVSLRNECDVPIHVLACATDSSGCDDADIDPGSEQTVNVHGRAEFYACPQRSNAVDLDDNPVTSAFVAHYRCMWS